MKLADNLPLSPTDYPINPKRLPNSAQDEKTGLFKLNLHPTEEHDLGFTYLRSKSSRWTPFSASSSDPRRASGPSTATATSWA